MWISPPAEPVLKGFIIGLALTIIVGQLPKLFGVEKTEGDFFEQLWDLLRQLDSTSGLTLVVELGSLVLVLGLKRLAPVVPGSLVAVLVGIAVVELFDLADDGVAIVGAIESGLPSVGLPDVGLSDYLDLVPAAAGVMLIGFAEGLGAAKTYASRNHYEVDANRELVGLGAANLGAGLSSGMVVNGSLSKTAVNGGAGASSQLSGLVVAVAALLGVLVFDTLPGLFIGIVVSLLLLLYRASRPHVALLGRVPTAGQWGDVERHPENEQVEGIVVLRPESPLFFANADAVRDAVRAHLTDRTRSVVLDETMPSIDVTAVTMLVGLADDLRRDGVELVLARDVGTVRDLVRVGAGEQQLRTFPTVRAAVAALEGGE